MHTAGNTTKTTSRWVAILLLCGAVAWVSAQNQSGGWVEHNARLAKHGYFLTSPPGLVVQPLINQRR